jgi:hypothetical protein
VVDREIWLGAYYHPKALTPYLAPAFEQLLRSIEVVEPTEADE